MRAARRQRLRGDGQEKADNQDNEQSSELPDQMSEPQDAIDAETEKKNREKDIISLRDKLRNGLLKPLQRPKRNDMKHMFNCLTKLEEFPDLESSIIRALRSPAR